MFTCPSTLHPGRESHCEVSRAPTSDISAEFKELRLSAQRFWSQKAWRDPFLSASPANVAFVGRVGSHLFPDR